MTIHTSTQTATEWYGVAGAPLVILAHDWYGRLPYLAELAPVIADAGFRVAVPDFYAGRWTEDDDDAAAMLQQRVEDFDGALQIAEDALSTGRAEGSQRAAIVGFSMGASIALAFAARGMVDAVAAFYGSNRPTSENFVRVPILFELAESDTWNDKESPEDFTARMREIGNDDVTLTYHPGAIHGFMNASIQRRFHQDVARTATASLLQFLQRTLAS